MTTVVRIADPLTQSRTHPPTHPPTRSLTPLQDTHARRSNWLRRIARDFAQCLCLYVGGRAAVVHFPFAARPRDEVQVPSPLPRDIGGEELSAHRRPWAIGRRR